MTTPIDVYCFSLSDTDMNRGIADKAVSLLDATEQARMSLFKNPQARDRFLLARYISKTQLGRRLGRDPHTIRFCYSSNGKPTLDSGSSRIEKDHAAIWFSLSHCAGSVVCAIASHDIGVDVETLSRCEKLLPKAEYFLSAGMARRIMEVDRLPPSAVFTAFWTCLEAQVKLKDSSIFTERRIFELVPDTNDHYRNNQDINLRAVTIQNENVISLACRSNFDVNVWLPQKCTLATDFELRWQPAVQNMVKTLFNASAVNRGDSR